MSKKREKVRSIDYGNSAGYNWVHNPFSEELPFKKVGEKKEKAKKYRGHDYKRGRKNG